MEQSNVADKRSNFDGFVYYKHYYDAVSAACFHFTARTPTTPNGYSLPSHSPQNPLPRPNASRSYTNHTIFTHVIATPA